MAYSPIINSVNHDDQSNKTEINDTYRLYNDVISMLEYIGYDTRNIKVDDHKFKLLIQAYQRHHRQSDVLGEIDMETLKLIKQHYKDVLT